MAEDHGSYIVVSMQAWWDGKKSKRVHLTSHDPIFKIVGKGKHGVHTSLKEGIAADVLFRDALDYYGCGPSGPKPPTEGDLLIEQVQSGAFDADLPALIAAVEQRQKAVDEEQ